MLSHPIYPELNFLANPVKATAIVTAVPIWVMLFRIMLILYDAFCGHLLEPPSGQKQRSGEGSMTDNLCETMNSILPWDESVL